MERFQLFQLITFPYVEGRDHPEWFDNHAQAMQAFEDWVDSLNREGEMRVDECFYEIRRRELTTMDDLLDALNGVDGTITSQAESEEWIASWGKPPKNATRVTLNGATA
jgi:hypothetical protein